MRTKHQTINDVIPSPLSKKAHEHAVAEVSEAVTKEMLRRLKDDPVNQKENDRGHSPRLPQTVPMQ